MLDLFQACQSIYLLAIPQNPILTAPITIKKTTIKTLTKIRKQRSKKKKRFYLKRFFFKAELEQIFYYFHSLTLIKALCNKPEEKKWKLYM